MALRLRGATSGYIELKAPASAGDNTLTLPVNNGSANQLLKTDGSGNLSWVDDNSGVSLSGSTNNTIATVTGANALTGEANLTFNGSGDLTVKGNDGISANLYLIADRGDDNGDGWRAGSNQDQNDLTIANNTTGSYVDKITVLKTGEVGIGTSTPGQKLGVAGNIRFESGDPTLEFNNGGAMVYARVANTLQFASGGGPASPTEKARIDSSGNLLIGRTSAGNTGLGHTLRGADSCIFSRDATGETMQISRNNSNGDIVQFRTGDTGNASICGEIVRTGASTVAYNTSSDYRLKENEVDISDGISRLKLLKPYRFNFKTEPSKTVDGFFAHEVTPAVPESVFGEKNDPDRMQGIDQSKLVPLLTAALKEAIAKIETLETKVAALESA